MFIHIIKLFAISLPFSAYGPTILEGKVYEAGTRKPLAYIHSYLKEGEEEDLTGKNGTFTIRTYAKAPYTITFSHPGYETGRFDVKKAGIPVEVFLKKKK
jgi:CarboxypepD_reg-like domain